MYIFSELDITGGSSNETNQKNKYAELFPIMWEHPSVVGITLWGYIEGSTWKQNTGLLNANLTERQAMIWLKGYMTGTITPNLTVSTNSVSLPSTASSSSAINITSNQAWNITSNQTWLTTSVISGNNNGSFTISVSANTGATSRTGNVVVTGGSITQTISVTQAGTSTSGNRQFTVRAKGTSSGAQLQLRLNNVLVKTWNLSTTVTNYTFTSNAAGIVRLQFANDATNRDIQVDYLQVNSTIYQAENQTINTAFYANGRCGGGGKSEMMHCNGYIEFAGSSSGRMGVEEIAENSEVIEKLNVYPNPTTDGKITLELQANENIILIYNSLGTKTHELENKGNSKIEINTGLKSGLYFLKVGDSKKMKIQKFIVQ